jgi:hypothetical protein
LTVVTIDRHSGASPVSHRAFCVAAVGDRGKGPILPDPAGFTRQNVPARFR